MYKPKTLTILSLAIGDVLLALFPMVVYTRILFNEYEPRTMPCSLYSTSNVYMPYLITFVYGFGLMVLGLEMILHHRISSLVKNSKIVCSIVCSSIPWVLGLIIVLPLGLKNINMDTCEDHRNIDQWRALLAIGIFLPACGAVLTSIIVKCKVKSPHRQAVNNCPQVMVTSSTQQTAHGSAPLTKQQGLLPTAPAYHFEQPSTFASPTYAFPSQLQYDQEKSQQFYDMLATSPCALITQPHYMHSGNPSGNFLNGTTPMQPTVLVGENSSDSSQKPARLLVISIVFLLLVTPFAIFILGYLFDTDAIPLGLVGTVTVASIVFWLNIIRSVITPLIMYGYSDN
ncbi:unnamed protein product [Lymnaea stagnalis]|uniref:G-protein coupled receptors family 1 profile domain-containing protein n=1 Tax=Lymnaea stagnalis TaxID=6523 RepID=A0AAV2IJN0_LYMST